MFCYTFVCINNIILRKDKFYQVMCHNLYMYRISSKLKTNIDGLKVNAEFTNTFNWYQNRMSQ